MNAPPEMRSPGWHRGGSLSNGKQSHENDNAIAAATSEQEAAVLFLALSATDAARGQLSRYAAMTDAPVAGSVEAADLLDAARAALAKGGAP